MNLERKMNDQEIKQQLDLVRKEAQEKANESFEKEREKLRNEQGISAGYKCYSCGNNTNFTFPLKFMVDSGLCPDCYWKEDNGNK